MATRPPVSDSPFQPAPDRVPESFTERRGSIFVRLLAGCALAVLVPVLVGLGAAYWAVGELAENEARARVTMLAERKVRWLDRFLVERMADANLVRRAPWVRDAILELTGQRAVPVRTGRRGPAPPTAAAVAREQLLGLTTGGNCTDAFLVTTNGDLILSALGRPELGGNLAGPTLRDSALTRAVLASRAAGQTVMSEVRVHRPTGRLALFVVAPVTSTGGVPLGFLGLEVSAAALHAQLRDDGDGARSAEVLLVSPDRTHVIFLSSLRDSRAPPPGSAVAGAAIDPRSALGLALRGGTGAGMQQGVLGEAIYGWWGPVPRLRCALLVALDPEDVQAPLKAVRRRLWTVGGITLGFALLAVWVMARGVARPVEDLAAGAERVAANEPEARTAVADTAEPGRISEVFDETLERLHAATAARGDLERQRQELRQRNTQLEEWVRALTSDRDRPGPGGAKPPS